MASNDNIVYTVVFLDLPADQYVNFAQPYYKPVAYSESRLLIHEEWAEPTIDIMPRINSRFAYIPYKATVKPDLIQPVVK